MADAKRRVDSNVAGDFFVDSSCINCGVSRHYAPKTFGDDGAHAFVKNQPSSEADTLAAQMALLACPVAAIGTSRKHDLSRARGSFPYALADNIFVNGYNHRSSYAAHSYFIRGDKENWMVDAPRFTKHLANNIEAMGGLDRIFLTHRDDVCDAHKYAAYFGAERVIHEFERAAQPDAEIILGACAVEVLMLGDWRAAAGEVGFWPECGHLARPTLGWKSQTGRPEGKRFAFHTRSMGTARPGASALAGQHLPQHVATVPIRLMFNAKHTRSHSPRTFAKGCESRMALIAVASFIEFRQRWR